MPSKPQISLPRKTLVGIMLLGVFLNALSAGSLSHAHAQEETAQTPACFTLDAVVAAGEGTLTVMTPQNCDGGYLEGTEVELIAVPADGYVFQNWQGSDDDLSSAPTQVLTMLSNRTVHGYFEIFQPQTDGVLTDPALCPASIGFGETIQCSVASTGEMDAYTFSALAGDHIFLRMTKTTGALWPHVHIYKEDGTALCAGVNVSDHSTVQKECTIPVNGNYTVRASDYTGTSTGDYYLFMQRLNNPGNSVSINFGETPAGSILTPAQNNTYTFSGTENDIVLIRLRSAFWAYLLVFDPDGEDLCGGVNAMTHQSVEDICTLPASGTYTILAGDYNGAGTGDHYLHLQRLNNPGSPSAIVFGQTAAGEVSVPAEMDAYTFSGNTGDILIARMGAVSGVYPELHVYNPDGTKLCRGYTAFDGDHINLECTLTSTGVHTILAGDHNALDTGDYYLYIQRLNDPGNTVPLNFGTTQAASIATPAEMDTYTFSATAGDYVLATTTNTEILLYDPDGIRICTLSRSFIDICLIPVTGTYTLLAGDFYSILTGNYHLYSQRLNNPLHATALGFGQTVSNAISLPAEMDAYTFTGSIGDKIFVRVSQAINEIRPGIRVYAPDGTRLCRTSGSMIAELATCTLTSTGSHTLLVNDYYGSDPLDYHVFLQRLNNAGNAISLTSGQTRTGSIAVIGEIDTYAFTASAGDQVQLKMTRKTGDLWPRIAVYDTDGVIVCSAWGYSTAEIASCALGAAGTYAVLVDDYLYQTHTGNYELFFKNLSSPDLSITVSSAGAQDGWVLESKESSKVGGSLNATATTLRLGDDKLKKQYLGILSFNTSSLPDNAVITSVILKVKKQSVTGGGDPVNTFQGFLVDIKKGFFGTAALQTTDFQTPVNKSIGPVSPALASGWYSINLTSGKAYINKLATNSGLTQFRLRFKLDDNNNAIANYLNLYSGNAPAASRPKLVIQYHLP